MNQQTLTASAARVCVILFVGTCRGMSASRRCPSSAELLFVVFLIEEVVVWET